MQREGIWIKDIVAKCLALLISEYNFCFGIPSTNIFLAPPLVQFTNVPHSAISRVLSAAQGSDNVQVSQASDIIVIHLDCFNCAIFVYNFTQPLLLLESSSPSSSPLTYINGGSVPIAVVIRLLIWLYGMCPSSHRRPWWCNRNQHACVFSDFVR